LSVFFDAVQDEIDSLAHIAQVFKRTGRPAKVEANQARINLIHVAALKRHEAFEISTLHVQRRYGLDALRKLASLGPSPAIPISGGASVAVTRIPGPSKYGG
jgi:hypothetical protein